MAGRSLLARRSPLARDRVPVPPIRGDRRVRFHLIQPPVIGLASTQKLRLRVRTVQRLHGAQHVYPLLPTAEGASARTLTRLSRGLPKSQASGLWMSCVPLETSMGCSHSAASLRRAEPVTTIDLHLGTQRDERHRTQPRRGSPRTPETEVGVGESRAGEVDGFETPTTLLGRGK